MLSQLTYGLTHIPEVIIPLFQSVGNWGYLCLFLKAGKETRSFKDVMNCLFLCP